jgi:hypothetical protein
LSRLCTAFASVVGYAPKAAVAFGSYPG